MTPDVDMNCAKCGKPIKKWTDTSKTALGNGIVCHEECPETTETKSETVTIKNLNEVEVYEYEAELGENTKNIVLHGENDTVEIEFIQGNVDFLEFIEKFSEVLVNRAKYEMYKQTDNRKHRPSELIKIGEPIRE